MRAVITQRFGLKGKKKTLELIGKEYKITRERVRQIEQEAFAHLYKDEVLAHVEPLAVLVENMLLAHGGVMAQHHLFSSLTDPAEYTHLFFVLRANLRLHYLEETKMHYQGWASDREKAHHAVDTLHQMVRILSEKQTPHDFKEMHTLLCSLQKEAEISWTPEASEALLAFSKRIRTNPYGEYGLAEWPSISPSGMREKAFIALAKTDQPLHFREVATAIDRAGWSKRPAHPQTVHNELIKDSRFVLVGRGTYGLREWGYEPGHVRDILLTVLRQAAHPLSREEIVELVLARRMVKVPTILLNLQDKTLFQKTPEEKYTLA